MVQEMLRIVDLIAHADNEEQIEGLLDVLIEKATVDDVVDIRSVLSDRFYKEENFRAKHNYEKAIKLL